MRDLHREGAHGLRDAWGEALADFARGLGRHIAHGEARTARRDDEADAEVGVCAHLGRDGVLFVGQDAGIDDLVARLFQHLCRHRRTLVLALAAAALVAGRDNGRVKGDGLFHELQRHARFQRAAVQHAREDALARHDAVTDHGANRAALVAGLANLRDLQHHVARAQARADGQLAEMEAVRHDVLAEGTEFHVYALLAEVDDLLLAQQADLAMPVTRMGIAADAVLRDEECLLHGLLQRALFLARAQRLNRAFRIHKSPPAPQGYIQCIETALPPHTF